MRYVQLRAFHYVALELSFSAAAKRLGLTQPALSDQIARLESAYDVRLFERDKRTVRLSEKGEELLHLSHRFFDAENAAVEFLRDERLLHQQNLVIMADSAQHVLADIRAYRQKYPMVQIHVETRNSFEILQALREYRADIGIVGAKASAEFHSILLGSSVLTAFCARTSDVARLDEISLVQLAKLPLVLRETGSQTRQMLEGLLVAQNLTLDSYIVAQGRETVREFVANGVGVGVVSKAEFGFDQRLKAITIQDQDDVMEERIICLGERRDSPAIRAFMNLAQSRLLAQI